MKKLRKILSYEECPRNDAQWELVVQKSLDYERPVELTRDTIQLLRYFVGSWIRADATICQLRSVAPPPGWSTIYWPLDGGNWMFFPLGRYVNIYLPKP